jgi:regulator of protease activity HflC (stomatin/prohibitin superfamily)
LTIVSAGLVFVQPEDRGVVISAIAQNGVRQEPLDPGLHWIIPFFENVKTYPIAHQTYTMSKTTGEGQVQGDDSITARTADGQEVFIDASVIYSVDPAQVVKVHIQWQDRYMDELIRPVSRGAIRDAISQYGIEQVVTSKRAEIAQKISDDMTQKFSNNGLNMYDFVLRNITFSPEYAASVEQNPYAHRRRFMNKCGNLLFHLILEDLEIVLRQSGYAPVEVIQDRDP